MRTTDLLTLAQAYCHATGQRLWPVSRLAAGSTGTLYRIKRGHGVHTTTFERALGWFDENWPAALEWPEDVPRPSAYNRPGAPTVGRHRSTGDEARAGGLARSGAPGRDCGPC